MMINFLIILGIIAIGAWLGNVLLSVEQRVSQARQRVRGVRNTLDKLDATIHRLHREEENLHGEIEDWSARWWDCAGSRSRCSTA